MSDMSKYTQDLPPEKRELFELLLRERQANNPDQQATAIPRRADRDTFPLSAAQQRLWFLDQWDPGSPNYNLPQAVHLRGRLNVAVLERSLNEIIERHEALRACFVTTNGTPVQYVAQRLTLKLPVLDLRPLAPVEQEAEVKRLTEEEAQRPFNLSQSPLMRAQLLRLATTEHVLLLTMHHIVSDGWSNGVFVREMGALYEAFSSGRPSPLPPLPIQYADFADWQQQWLRGDVLDSQLTYWERQLKNAPSVLELPTDRPRPTVQTFHGATKILMLPPDLSSALNAYSQREGVTLFMTLLTAFKTLLYRYIGQDDIVVGSPIANRNHGEIEPLIGTFVNTLVLRTDLSGSPTFRDLLRRVREVCLGAYAHQDLPFEKLVDELRPERDISHSTLFQIMFALQNAPMPVLEGRGLRITPLHTDSGTAKFDLSLDMMETEEGLLALLEYNTDLFDADTMMRLWRHFHLLLEHMVADPDQRIDNVLLLTAAERQQLLVDWTNTATPYPAARSIHMLFEAQVARTPDAIAVVWAGKGAQIEQLTYQQLNIRANQLAHYLRHLGVGPDVLVGLCVERSPEMIVGLLGILKAGGAYVPLDPAYPAERLQYMLTDICAPVIVTQQHLLAALPEHTAQRVCLDADWPTIALESQANPAHQSDAGNLAYIIYTSGSTGKPKGVMVQHHGLMNYTSAACAAYEHHPDDRVLQFASLNFDASAEEIYPCLISGAALVLRTDALLNSFASFLQLCQEWRLTVLDLPTAYWHELTAYLAAEQRSLPASVRLVIIGGEQALPERVLQWQQHVGQAARLVNTYGPTEATIVATMYDVSRQMSVLNESYALSIGRAIQNIQVYVLDRRQQPVPVGVHGELYIGGDGLARGYLNRPDLTAETFLPHPFVPDAASAGARLYHTGDLAHWRADGTLVFVGRVDQQVKIRGFRIELGEIEAALRQHPALHDTVVIARAYSSPASGGSPDQRLVAYIVPAGAHAPTSSDLHSFLRMTLPDYMVPAVFMPLSALPLLPNGKIDRQALPTPDQLRPDLAKGFLSPRNPVEDVLTGIWAEVLDLNRVGVHDNFFELGGHSLLATQVISRVCNTFQIDVPLRSLFDKPTIAGLAAQIEVLLEAKQGRESPPIVPADRSQPLPLSFSQERLWFIDQLTPGNTAYNTPGAARFRGRLNLAALERSFKELVRRHEILRTTFQAIKGQPIQKIVAPDEWVLSWSVEDLQHLPEIEREPHGLRIVTHEAQQSFDLARGPLFRVKLLQLNPELHLLVLPTHHIIYDLMSVGVFMREMQALYEAFDQDTTAEAASPLPPLTIQYTDFAAWQRGWLQGDVLAVELEYWRQQLAGAPTVLELPTARPRPPIQTFQGARQHLNLSPELSKGLKALSRQEGSTTFMLLLTAFKTLLYRYTGQTDLLIGSPIANRTRYEVEDLIGFFVNTLVLRTDLSGNPTFRQLLGRVREVCLGAYAHQDLPFEKLVETLLPDRDLSRNPLFQVMFSFLHNYIAPVSGADDLSVEVIRLHGERSQFDLSLDCWETGDRLLGSFDYNTDLFDAETMTRFAVHLETLLASIVANPDLPIGELNMLTPAEQQQLMVDWSTSLAEQPTASCIHELFEVQVARTPDALAVIVADTGLTYRELNERADQLAYYLRTLGVGPEVFVGLCVERSLEAIVGILGVLKAGGAYVPLDPAYPSDRLSYMLADTRAPVVITQQRCLAALPAQSGHVVCLDTDWSAIVGAYAEQRHAAQINSVGGLNPAYIIYTSGSTGRPKGVFVTHQSLVSSTQARLSYYAAPDTRFLLLSSFAFDSSVAGLFGTLCQGGMLCLPVEGFQSDPTYLVDLIARQRISHLLSLPSLYAILLQAPPARLATLRAVVVAGEACPPELVARHANLLGQAELFNEYGPTEGTVWSTVYRCSSDVSSGQVPIGRPIAGMSVYLLDTHQQPVPVGVHGELYIGGDGLARGYLNRPDLTAETFLPHPFVLDAASAGARLYRTGDLAHWRADGTLVFVGRVDQQVKIRGFRIELGEIEVVLHQHPAIHEAVVMVRADAAASGEQADQRLVAYLVADEPPTASELRTLLKAHLPEYMVPSAFVTLPALPLTPNGKVDRRALPAPDGARPALEVTFVPPRNATEQALSEVWATVLRLERIGIHDNFFDLGGHSLLATQVISRLREDFQIEVALRTLFELPTIAELAANITAARWAIAGLGSVGEDEEEGEL